MTDSHYIHLYDDYIILLHEIWNGNPYLEIYGKPTSELGQSSSLASFRKIADTYIHWPGRFRIDQKPVIISQQYFAWGDVRVNQDNSRDSLIRVKAIENLFDENAVIEDIVTSGHLPIGFVGNILIYGCRLEGDLYNFCIIDMNDPNRKEQLIKEFLPNPEFNNVVPFVRSSLSNQYLFWRERYNVGLSFSDYIFAWPVNRFNDPSAIIQVTENGDPAYFVHADGNIVV